MSKIEDRLFESGGEEKIAMRRQLAYKESKYCCLMHLVLAVALQHCELIEIGQQRAISRIHVSSSFNEKLYQCCQGIHA